MAAGQPTADTLVCSCYEVTEEQVRRMIEAAGTRTVEEIALYCGAGSGCTACHCRLQRLLAGLPATCRALEMCSTCGFHAADCACQGCIEQTAESPSEQAA